MHRRLPLAALSVASFIVLCGSRSNCDSRPATLTCTPQNISLLQGTCAPITNPCDTQWRSQDGFKLCDEPAGLTIQTTRSRGTVTRQICADAAMANLSNMTVGFLYTQTDDFGEGTITISVGAPTTTPLSIVAAATPSTVNMGNGSQLDVAVTGGSAPYTFLWTPPSTLTSDVVQNPTAFPLGTTTYTVTVTDSTGATAVDTVTVTVNSQLVVTASPSQINLGMGSQLLATYQGGVPPLFYSWSPSISVSNHRVPNPIAVPATTTTYTVTVTDGTGATVSGSVTLTVNLNVFASASPTLIAPGQTSNLNVAASGGTPPYTYSWTDPETPSTISDPTSPTPTVSPAATATYDVTVTDSLGQTATRSVTVATSGTVLGACFTTIPAQPQAGQFFTIDMSCSTGSVAIYRLWLNYSPTASPVYAGTQSQYQTMAEVPITFNTRVEVEDASGNRVFIDQPIVIQ